MKKKRETEANHKTDGDLNPLIGNASHGKMICSNMFGYPSNLPTYLRTCHTWQPPFVPLPLKLSLMTTQL